jgi:hypothetical protein
MSIFFRDILFAPKNFSIHILHPTSIKNYLILFNIIFNVLNVNLKFWNFNFVYNIHFAPNNYGIVGSHVSFFMSNMFRDIHFAPSVIYLLHPTIPSYTCTILNVNFDFFMIIKMKFILIFHFSYLNFIQY